METSLPHRPAPWVRAVVGDPAAFADLRGLRALDSVRIAWWALGLTPTARLRSARFGESVRDRRGLSESLRIARAVGA